MSDSTAWNDEPDLDEETAARLDRFLQAGKAETRRLLADAIDAEQKLGESLARIAADGPDDPVVPQPLLKGRHIA
ncbi:hypothetical protein ACF1GT_36170 [Streptomyces sp. NPDC014636]|uniref:hypothetical protein n=1 Tax=Streptomyces sp. NPDC014636 TaxID=3364876 RepID=UPI0036F90EF8